MSFFVDEILGRLRAACVERQYFLKRMQEDKDNSPGLMHCFLEDCCLSELERMPLAASTGATDEGAHVEGCAIQAVERL